MNHTTLGLLFITPFVDMLIYVMIALVSIGKARTGETVFEYDRVSDTKKQKKAESDFKGY